MRAPTSNKRLLNSPDVDGFYTCQYTGLKVLLQESIFLGPCLPQVNGTYVCHPTATPFFRESKRAFDESEANCNTCKNLVRARHAPRKDGQMLGTCPIVGAELMFHPDDSMGMPCYEQRPEKTT